MSDKLAARVRGMISRAVVSLVNDALKMQALQVTMMAGQTPDDAEHFQHYGFTSVPLPGAEGIALAVGGSTGHTVVINVDDRRYRIKPMPGGEVCLYDDLEHKVHLTRDGIVIDGAGQIVRITNTPLTKVESDMQVTGNLQVDGDTAITGDTNMTGKLDVIGDTTLGNTVIGGTFGLGGGLNVPGNLVVGGSIDATLHISTPADVNAGDITLGTHRHELVTTGTDPSGGPIV
jgi:phage baseplate assembly protein V